MMFLGCHQKNFDFHRTPTAVYKCYTYQSNLLVKDFGSVPALDLVNINVYRGS